MTDQNVITLVNLCWASDKSIDFRLEKFGCHVVYFGKVIIQSISTKVKSMSWLGWFTVNRSRLISLMYSWPIIKTWFYQGNHVITLILNKHLKASYARCHYRQWLFQNSRPYFEILRFFPISNAEHAVF